MRAAMGSAAGVLSLVMICLLGAGAEAGGESAALEPEPQLKQFHLTGRVLLPDGSPAAGATVFLRCYGAYVLERGEREWTDHTATTGARGRYDFGPLPVPRRADGAPGTGNLMAILEGCGFDSISASFKEEDRARGLNVFAGPKGEVEWDMKLSPAISLSGAVVGPDDEPLAGATPSPARRSRPPASSAGAGSTMARR